MSIRSLLKSLAPKRINTRRRATSRLRVEPLEDRRMLSFIIGDATEVGPATNAALAADFNNDGVPDLAMQFASAVNVNLGVGDGTFRAPLYGATGGNLNSPMAAGDFDGDGNIDLVFADYYDHQVGFPTVTLGNGDGTFQSPQFVPLEIPPAPPESWLIEFFATRVAVADTNSDGNLDLLFTCGGLSLANSGEEVYTFSSTAVALGDGTGRFTSAFSEVDEIGGFAVGNIVGADLNADGKVDLVGANGARYGRGDGTFNEWQAFGGPLGFNVVVNDFNGDGRPDIAVTSFPDGSGGSIRLNNGNGNFQPAQPYVSGPNPADLATADFNGDGKLDLVTLHNGNIPSLTLCLGNGNGTFQGPLSFPTAPGNGRPSGMALADFNGDDLADISVRASNSPAYSHNLRVLLNDGNWSPPIPSVTISDVAVTEGNSGTRTATFTVTLSAPSSQIARVVYATTNNTASAGGDYQASTGVVTFLPAEITKSVVIIVNGDRAAEMNETFLVNLSNPTNATIADGQGVGTILDDEPRISLSDVNKAEGKKNQTTLFTFTVTLSAAYDQPMTISFRTVDGQAKTGDQDYVGKTGKLTFAPGETSKTITIEVKGDNKKESNEAFYVDLFGNSSNSQLIKNRGLGTILNDD